MMWARGSEQKELVQQQQDIEKAETPVIHALLHQLHQDNNWMMENFDHKMLMDDVAKFLAKKSDVDKLLAKVKHILEMHRAKLRMVNSRKK